MNARGVYSLGRRAYLDASDEFAFASNDRGAEYRAQCDILRDVFGNVARPVTLEPAWLTRNGGAVEKIARAIYDERALEAQPAGSYPPWRLRTLSALLRSCAEYEAEAAQKLEELSREIGGGSE